MSAPLIIIISGPNGAGKSTSASGLLPPGVPYINADEIAKGLNTDPNASKDMEASRLLLAQWEQFAHQRQSFAIETTLASRSLAPKIRKLQEIGYEFQLYYFWLPNPEMAVSRVAERVKSGGHPGGRDPPPILSRLAQLLRALSPNFELLGGLRKPSKQALVASRPRSRADHSSYRRTRLLENHQ